MTDSERLDELECALKGDRELAPGEVEWLIKLARGEQEIPHCSTCACGRRAPVQGDRWDREKHKPGRGPGTITWKEHLEVWSAYASRYSGQSAERLAERGGFGYSEAAELLGRPLRTWRAGALGD